MTTPRRDFLKWTAGLAAGAFVAPRSLRGAVGDAGIEILDTKLLAPDDSYRGWPTLARKADGELLVVCSGGREEHVCPFGRVEMLTSRDDGATWTWPRVLLDGPIDDRDAGILVTARGTLIVTTFTSLAYEPMLAKATAEPTTWPAERLARWQGVHSRLTAEERQRELGVWAIRSTDGGISWSERRRCLVNSPHGPIQLSDGRLLYPGKELWQGERRVGVAESYDDGENWHWLAEIPAREGDKFSEYHELHGVETATGRIVVQIRNHNPNHARETLQSDSTDGGRTWSVPRSIGVWGLPSFLMKLRDGRLLMTYGHRRAPLGNQARVSSDDGQTWSEPVIISGDGTSGDLGYPSTVQLDDDSLLTVWYEKLKDTPRAALRQCRWKLT